MSESLIALKIRDDSITNSPYLTPTLVAKLISRSSFFFKLFAHRVAETIIYSADKVILIFRQTTNSNFCFSCSVANINIDRALRFHLRKLSN